MHRIAFALLLCGPAVAVAADDSAHPNVIVILADDQGWGDLSINGNPAIRTPHVDSLAADGARFERFFVQPVCSPTRAEFLTGRWHPRGGVRGVSTGQERLDLDEATIAAAFRTAGYATGCFGKWHNGTQYPYHPNGRGFDEYYGFTSGHWGEYFDPPLDHNGQAVQGEGYISDDFTTHAIDFLKENVAANRPSFCYLAFCTPHSPMQVPDEYWERFRDADVRPSGSDREEIDHTRAALAMCENIDDNVGRILSLLDESGLADNTIVVYFTDNGPNGPRWNGGMKGHKGTTDEGGVRSPLHIRWPGRIEAGTVVQPIAGAIDLYPTLIDLAGIERTGDEPFDGISLAPWLRGDASEIPDRVLYHHWAGRVSARTQQFRLDHTGQLFDLDNDPGQRQDIGASHPEIAARLTAAVDHWKQSVLNETASADDRPFPVGYPEFVRTVLPARDGVPHGGVERSSRAPNCSFFTHWTSIDDRITWDIEVHTAGRYEAILHYTCPEPDAGSAVKLTLGEVGWTGLIDQPHDPPLRGAEQDRVSRGPESYVKDFRPLSLGVIHVPEGRGTLTLRAADVPGETVADVRMIELILVK